MSKVVVICGPTASGKTSTSIHLAKRFNGVVVNFDSLLLYREINIGTAKPTKAEQEQVPHEMIDVRSIDNPMNAAVYASEALPKIEALLKTKRPVFLVGGSGFYLQALLKGMYDSPTTPASILTRSDELYSLSGIAPFLEILKENDPGSFKRYHENDHYRIRRAVEHWWAHGSAFFEERLKKDDANENLQNTNVHGWDLLTVYLDLPKPEHLKIIEKRTEQMIKDGLIQEVKDLLKAGHGPDAKPLQSIGYKETLDLIRSGSENLSEYKERIIISTRQLAKSQRTWFNRDKNKITFNPVLDLEKITQTVDAFLIS